MNRYDKANAEIFQKITAILESTSSLNYKIMGYKHVSTKLILYFSDCAQVYEFTTRNQEGDGEDKLDFEVKVTKFFTSDYANHNVFIESLNKFSEEYDREVPELPKEETTTK